MKSLEIFETYPEKLIRQSQTVPIVTATALLWCDNGKKMDLARHLDTSSHVETFLTCDIY